MTEPLITILDDTPEIRRLLSDTFQNGGFRTRSFGNAKEFEAALPALDPDVCVIDLGLPDKDGLGLVHRLARSSGAAIMIISGRAMTQDKIVGLELGADDYITKPFDPDEVLARARALLRRRKPTPTDQQQRQRMSFGDWLVDFDLYQLTHADGDTVPLSQAEGEVLRLFLKSPNRLITRDQILSELDHLGGDAFDRAIDVRVSRLRTKLRDDPKNPNLIKTIYGAGYVFIGDPNSA